MVYLSQACGLEVYDLGHVDLTDRPLLLARYLATTPLTLWRWRQREPLSSCPTCSRPYSYSLRESHTETCPYLALCLPLVKRHVNHIARYLSREWRKTRTQVALEFKYDPWLIIIATLRNYPDHTYRDAGELVEAVLSLEEAHIPTWNAQTVIDWFSTLPPLPPTPAPTLKPPTAPPAVSTPSGASAPTPPGASASGSSAPTTTSPEAAASTTPTLGAVAPPVTSKPSVSSRLKSLQCRLFKPAKTTPTSARKQELVKEAFDLSLPSRCKVCTKAEATAMIVDCGHAFVCLDCIRTQASCPVCLTDITDFVKVYRA